MFYGVMSNKVRSACAWACMLAGTGVFADDYAWTDNASAKAKWTNQANWRVAGEIPEQPPTNGVHAVRFGPLATDARQEIELDVPENQSGGSTYPLVLSSIVDETPQSRRSVWVRNAQRTLKEVGVSITVDRLADFSGFWHSVDGHVLFNLSDGDTLANIAADRRARVAVPASASATLGTLYTEGTLDKQGSGELALDATQGADTRLVVSDGTLTLAGRPAALDAGDDLPVPGAWLHLDASHPETFRTKVGEDGRTYVTNWCDVRGNGVCAYFDAAWKRAASQTHRTEFSSAPFLNDTFRSGHTVVDFGRYSTSQDESLGPVGCWLRISQSKTNVREVFYAGCYSHDSGGGNNFNSSIIPGVLDDGIYHFHRGGSRLVSTTYASPGVIYGDVLVNNVPKSNDWTPTAAFHVFSVGATNNVRVDALATDRMYANRVGDARLGEFILFTNALTHAERVRIQTHLMHKWGVNVASAEMQDASSAVLSKDASALSVPAGRTACVGEVTAGGGTFVKKGAGHLEVGVLAVPATGTATAPSLEVQGGSVSLTGLTQPASDDEPASDAWLWLDATAADSFVYTNKTDDATQYVARWNDRRPSQSAIYAELPVGKSDYKDGNFAARLPNAVGDLSVVDFGPYGSAADGAAYLKLNAAGYQKSEVYEAFVVMNIKGKRSLPVFGSSSNIRFYRSSTVRLLQGDYGIYETHNALWTVDGVPVDPLADGQGAFAANRFYVVSASMPGKVYVDLVGGKDRLGQGTSFGGMQVAEQILYSRRLTPDERRQTIAYLMKKWQGRTPAFAAQPELASVRYASGASATFDTDADVSVKTVSGGDGAFVKKGTGTLKVSSFDALTLDAVSVEEGRMELTLDFIQEAAFHFDASDVGALTYYVTEDGARTNVTSVADVRRNGVRANAWINNPTVKTEVEKTVTPWVTNYVNRAVAFTNPVWRAIQAAPGVSRPTFDFGRESGYYAAKYDSSSALRVNASFQNVIKEAYAVFANNGYGDGGTVFGHASDHHYMTGGSVLFSTSYSPQSVKDGYIALDGETVAYNAAYPAKDTGLHVLAVKPTGDTSVNAMGCERNINAGGNYISEFIGFTNELTGAQRTCLQQYLKYKWTEAGTLPAFPKALSSLDVAAGATLALKGDMAVSVARIAGAGRVTGTALQNVAEIDVTCAAGETQPATLETGVTFANAVEIVFTGDTTGLKAGEHVLLRANALCADNVAWSLSGIKLGTWQTRITAENGNLVLQLKPMGLRVLIR